MILLPIVERELRVASRRHGTFTVRLVVALAAILVSVFLYLANLQTPPQLLAHRMFLGLSVLAFIYCLASGRRLTADCLSEEKREGTLGLLFLTDLKGHDVVLGKLTATSLNAFYCLMAIVPVLALPLLFGGVTYGEFWRMVLVLLATFLFSLAVGMFASVLSRDARQAMGTNFLLLLLFACGLPAIGMAVAYFTPNNLFIPSLMLPCPGYAFYLSTADIYRPEAAHFWLSLVVIHGMTWVLIMLSSWRVRYAWQDVPANETRFGLRTVWNRLLYGTAAQRRGFRRKLLNVNAFYWLASRARLKPLLVWLFLGFVGCWWLFMWLELKFNWVDESMNLTAALMLNSILKAWLAIEACQRLAEEQRMGSLELLLSTPMTTRDILWGQYLALRRQFLWPLLAVSLLEIFMIFTMRQLTFQMDGRVLWFGFGGLVMLALDALSWPAVAMSAALTAKSPNYASAATMGRVVVMPWLVIFAAMVTLGIWLSAAGAPGPGWKAQLFLWFICGLAADIGFGVSAWVQLRNHFRELALSRLRGAPTQH